MKTKFALLLLGLWLGSGAWLVAQPTLDLGDAPAPFPTLVISNGARHTAVGPVLGNLRDTEFDGLPNMFAQGDDGNAQDDEDGVVFISALVPGQTATIRATLLSPTPAKLDAWMDFGRDGSWAETLDRIFNGRTITNGVNTLTFSVPAGTVIGATFARFRVSSDGVPTFAGSVSNGEVEDYQVGVSEPMDFGDAPTNNYATLLSQNGARHRVVPNFMLGSLVDTEPDGQPSPTANGDDAIPAGTDDEDGITFTSSLAAGSNATLQVVCTMNAAQTGKLNAWIDFNADGDWNDAGEEIFTDVTVGPGAANFTFTVPAAAAGGPTFARFRLNANGKIGPNGSTSEGEVEDYQVNIIAARDFGDAPTGTPTANYPTLLSQDGARHFLTNNFCLGTKVDGETNGQPGPNADGDDTNPAGGTDDEDGVSFTSSIIPGQNATVQVFVTGSGGPTSPSGLLNAWLDFNRDGDWLEVGEQIFTNTILLSGLNNLAFNVPAAAVEGSTYARFRLNRQGGLSFTGASPDGEVEDYRVNISPDLDFGDAPPPYPTLMADNGARHLVNRSIRLGPTVDSEPDGQPDANATGDDLNPSAPDDEDGVNFTSPLVAGAPATLQVVASVPGLLHAWVDFDGNGSWAGAGEKIFSGTGLAAGPNNLGFNVPASAKIGKTFARFRFTTQTAIVDFVGLMPDGEVEDYPVSIITDRERCDLDCEGRDYWLTFPGNYAPDTNNPVRASLAIAGAPGTIGTVSIPGLGFTTNFTIPATRAAYVPLIPAADLGDLNDAVTNKGIHVVASASVRVTAFNQVHYTTDSYLGLNTSIIGTDYIVLGFGNEHTNVPPLNGTQFAIVGTESNTLVRIIPSVTTLGHPAGVPYYLTLQPGDCYQLRNTNDGPTDLAGTFVRSDKPIGVFGSHQVANIPSSNVWFADYIVEQLLPVNTWGTDFYTAPLFTRAGDTFRCLASQNGTTVSLNGAVLAVLNRGQFKQLSITNAGARITADKPIFVAQYANSSDYDGVVNADPFMLTVQATRHYVNGYIVTTPTNDFAANYLNIIAPTSAVASVLVDGGVAGAFTPITGTAYAYRRHPVTPGAHTVVAGAPISVSVYGWAEYESYGHPGCFFVGDVVPPTVSTPTTGATASVNDYPNTPGFVPVPDATTGAQTQDNCDPQPATPTQTPQPGTLFAPGIHTITLTMLDTLGNIGETNFTLTVVDPSPVIISCSSNLVVNCGSNNGAFVSFIVIAHSTYDTNVPVVSTPPSGSFFPAGTTVVTNVATSLAGQSDSCTFTVTVVCDNRIQGVLANNSLNLSWAGTATLQFASNVNGPWSNVVSGVSFFAAPLTGQQGFFRLKY